MSKNTLSLRLDLQSCKEGISWRAFHRKGGGNTCLSGFLSAPEKLSPEVICARFADTLEAEDLHKTRTFGYEVTKKLIPEAITKVLYNFKSGDILFVVPLKWADVPFELLVVDSVFLGQRFRTGTIIATDCEQKVGVETLSDKHILIIADPAQNLPSAFDEGTSINKLAIGHNKRSRLLCDVDRNKLIVSLSEATMIHFAGHSVVTKDSATSGWKLNGGELFTPADIAEALANGTKAGLVFSNSCDAAKLDNVAGVAAEFLNAGVPQFVAPIIKVRDEGAKCVALHFYTSLFQGRSVSQALLDVRKKIIRDGMEIAALSYRLFGDPCVTFSTANKYESDDVATKRKIIKWILVGMAIVIICIMVTVVIFSFGQNNVIYIPAK